jgi:hypothetical protein
MAIRKVVPGSLTEAYKLRQGDFSPSLVGNQFTDPNAFFTLGNFAVTSNFQGRVAKDFKLGEWSDYYSLENLNVTEEEADQVVSNNLYIRLNFDKTNLERYVYFGNFSKFLESEIQDVILKWTASLNVSVDPVQPTTTRPSNLNTVLDFIHDIPTNKTYFKTPKSAINNPYSLDYSNDSFGSDNIPQQIFNYVLSNENNEEFVINSMTGSTPDSNYVYFEVEGNPFTTITGTTFGKVDFHVKPIKPIRDNFFNNLTDFQMLLLNRLTTPQYTFIVDVPIRYDDGDIGLSKKSFTWPTSDGYNLDINTIAYGDYIEDFFKVAGLYDQNKTDLVVRRLVSESIVEYDTEGDGTESTGLRVSKLLRIYGAEFDVVKKYINGISFANVVTYNKKDNTSDNLIKIMAKTLGFDVLLVTSSGFSLLENDNPDDDPTFQGYSRALSPKEIDIELWRRLVINAWWLFRSKGTRKVLEFFLKLFGINNCLVSMDELVYIAKDKLDLLKTREQLTTLVGFDFFDENFNELPFDNFGFPKTPTDTTTFWFQNDGFWYNGGNESVIGNNPHYGPYDYGQRYWSKFRCFIDDFEEVTTVDRTENIITNYFNEYNNGTFTPNEEGQAFSNYGIETPQFFINPNDNINVISAGLVVYGEDNGPTNVRDTGDTYSLRITFRAGESSLCDGCPPINSFGEGGLVLIQGEGKNLVPHNIEECCDFYWLPREPIRPVDVVTDGTNSPAPIEVIPIEDLLVPKGLLPNKEENEYYCWWCPPESSLVKVCNSDQFIRNLDLTDEELISLAISYGYNGNNILDAKNYLITISNSYFNSGNCFYMINGSLLKNPDCCELRGGEWNQDLKLCEILKPSNGECSPNNVTTLFSLVGEPIDPSQPVTATNFEMLTQSCCQSLGYYYGLTQRTIYNLDGSITYKLVDQQTVNLLATINPKDTRTGCFVCPIEYKETVLTGNDSTTIIVVTDLNNNNLSENCCTSLGFTHTLIPKYGDTPICLKCSTNPVVNPTNNTVKNDDGSNLSQECCTQNGYYYYNGTEIDNGCYICPPFVEGSYSIINSTINGHNYTLITDANGSTLSPQCCDYYRVQSNNPKVVYADGVGCIFI